ncbi:MAG: class I SAM-dependent methyltransferase, partial [Chloroflexi bacterium]|nr:class I SAM-dependent methyltransferase [Chloroflexota bacterium]
NAVIIILLIPTEPLQLIDLASGPGSATRRMLRYIPHARVAALDIDPWLIALGQHTLPSSQVTWREVDLRLSSWPSVLPWSTAHAAICATALSWFQPDELPILYRTTAHVLAPGGALLLSDFSPPTEGSIAGLTQQFLRRWQARPGPGADWPGFWRAVSEETAFTELWTQRTNRLGYRRSHQALSAPQHTALLLDAGFREVGEIWRYHEAAIFLALR